MKTYSFYPTLLNDFRNYQTEKRYGDSDFILCDEQRLLDKLNRLPYVQSEAMLKGIAFERVLQGTGYVQDGFDFDMDVVDEMRTYVKGGVWQRFVQFSIPVDGARVKLYGYVDVTRMWQTIDVKTGAQYNFPGFDDQYQHHVYLLGSRAENIQVSEHLYLITDFKQVYKEPYDYCYEKMILDLQLVCRDLISFIELRKDVIHTAKLWQ